MPEASADLSFELSGSRFIEPLPSTANRGAQRVVLWKVAQQLL